MIYYWIGLPAYLLAILIAYVRLVDLGPDQREARHMVRRASWVAVGSVFAVFLAFPLARDHVPVEYTAWFDSSPIRTLLAWAVVGVWSTTEKQPPLYDYLLGVHRHADEWKNLPFKERMHREWLAIKASFTLTRNRMR